MTDDQKRQQMGELLLEYHEAVKDVAHLEEQAKRSASVLLVVSDWLKDISRSSYEMVGRKKVLDLDNPVHMFAMNAKEVLALEDQLRVARLKVRELDDRKKALGL